MENEQKILKLLETMQSDMKTMRGDVDKIHQSQTRMEHEHGQKMSALFDGYKLLSEKLDDHTTRLQRIEEKIVGHDIKIEVLDQTKANKRKVK